jgi:hypothetical protein
MILGISKNQVAQLMGLKSAATPLIRVRSVVQVHPGPPLHTLFFGLPKTAGLVSVA